MDGNFFEGADISTVSPFSSHVFLVIAPKVAILVLFCILTPTFMWADSNKLTNIHSSKQINTLIKFKSLRGENPDLYRTLKYQYRFEVNNCIEQLKTLDFHNSKYYRCKKIANDISVRID